MLGVHEYFWRLLPANPILLRVVETSGKKRRDLFIRCGYLGLLVVIVLISLATSGDISGLGLAGLSATSQQIFRSLSYLQLGLVALLAPIFTAGAITQEKDSQTYDILLSTPLTNGQIVLGSLLSRLFFVIALLVSGIPVFSVTQIFGGVAIGDIAMSFAIAAATAFVTGSLAMAIATFKVGTRRTIFSFYLFIVVYLVGLALVDRLPFTHPVIGYETNAAGQIVTDPDTNKPIPIRAATSWLTGIHPFLSLQVITDPSYVPPEIGQLPEGLRSWPLGYYLTRPQAFYVNFMFLLSLALVTPSILLLRRMAQSTLSLKAWALTKLKLGTGDRTRKPRTVWNNPIAWREAKTKASAFRASLLRYVFIGAGLLGALVLVILFGTYEKAPARYITRHSYNPAANTLFIVGDTTYGLARNLQITLNGQPAGIEALGGYYEVDKDRMSVVTLPDRTRGINILPLKDVQRRLGAREARSYLLGAAIIEFAVILLIVTNAAASTVTREKEDGSLDLLLSTPITSRYYIWGKLRGLVIFVLPLVAVPVLSVLMFVIYDLFRLIGGAGSFQWIVFPEAVLILPGTLVIVAAFASILGMQMSLRCRTTVRAVMSSVGIILGISGTLGWCGYQVLDMRGSGEFSLVFAAFSPFTVLTVLIDPYSYGGGAFDATRSSADMIGGRILLFVFAWVATAAYAAVVWAMYRSMVKNFDMTIRKQSR